MIDIKMLKGTGPYNQMKRYIEEKYKELTPQQRAGKFTALLKKFIVNSGKQDIHRVAATVRIQFVWGKTPEKWGFWYDVDSFSNAPIEKLAVKEQPPVKEQPAPVVGLVWPKGFYVCVQIPTEKHVRFINEQGQHIKGEYVKWANPGNFHNWQMLYQTIKRPETPLPNGVQWEEGYTHAAIYQRQLFQFNEKEYKYQGVVKVWLPNGKKEEWFQHKDTLIRYPDNQPFVAAPVKPVEVRKAEPVPQAPVVKNVAAKAPVEPPKAMPKQKVGWWV